MGRFGFRAPYLRAVCVEALGMAEGLLACNSDFGISVGKSDSLPLQAYSTRIKGLDGQQQRRKTEQPSSTYILGSPVTIL